ncbi:hypothetical protein G3545_08545 [Starkeya sp. ORNL1]|uniref:hypothetical protein n=1 Tax=Starkeya sp. ORNL1 TaxID=2709380 RepID=UPI001464449B|nr:hypothetical protein [Starkeya sp. ORNL1]QJP13701.1 hypothetical protein G3545_08545 [Starkeya sp. ORNL1]
MTLLEAIRTLDELSDDGIIYAKEPWRGDAEAIVLPDFEDEAAIEEAVRLGFKYFLEVFIAREFLEDWSDDLRRAGAFQEICDRVIYYATYDA